MTDILQDALVHIKVYQSGSTGEPLSPTTLISLCCNAASKDAASAGAKQQISVQANKTQSVERHVQSLWLTHIALQPKKTCIWKFNFLWWRSQLLNLFVLLQTRDLCAAPQGKSFSSTVCLTFCRGKSRKGWMRHVRLLSGEMRVVTVWSPGFLGCLSGCPSH